MKAGQERHEEVEEDNDKVRYNSDDLSIRWPKAGGSILAKQTEIRNSEMKTFCTCAEGYR
jgi:hypothetical protein